MTAYDDDETPRPWQDIPPNREVPKERRKPTAENDEVKR
jgi:hypothetical protein